MKTMTSKIIYDFMKKSVDKSQLMTILVLSTNQIGFSK